MNKTPYTIEGFEVPVHQSLTQPVLLAGVPRSFALFNLTATGVLTLGLGVWWLSLPIGLTLHSVAVYLTANDPLWFEVGRRHVKHLVNHHYLEL